MRKNVEPFFAYSTYFVNMPIFNVFNLKLCFKSPERR